MAVVPTRWIAWCDLCGTAAPEERDSQQEAERDLETCPCREDQG